MKLHVDLARKQICDQDGNSYASVPLADKNDLDIAILMATAPLLLEALKLCVTEGAPESNRERAEIAHAAARAAIAATQS